MLTGKQRSYLKGLANTLKPILQIGKDGISDSFIAQLEETIAVRELVKISILESCDVPAKEAAHILTERTGSDFVQAIGRKVTIYRMATEPENRKIEIPGMPKPKVIKPVEEPVVVRVEKPKPAVPVSGKAKAAPAKVKPNSAKKAKEVAKERSKKAKAASGARGSKPGATKPGAARKSGASSKRPAKRG